MGVGQDGDVRDLHKSLHFQLTNTALPASLRETSEIFAALQEAAVGQNLLLVIDDAPVMHDWVDSMFRM